MGYSRYIARRRARFNAIGGHPVNIPYGTAVECRNGFLHFAGYRLCSTRSLLVRDFFCQDDDGNGQLRGQLVTAILDRLDRKPHKEDPGYQQRWDAVGRDALCQQYRRPEHKDHWLWSHDFFNAPVEDLRHIAALVGAKVR